MPCPRLQSPGFASMIQILSPSKVLRSWRLRRGPSSLLKWAASVAMPAGTVWNWSRPPLRPRRRSLSSWKPSPRPSLRFARTCEAAASRSPEERGPCFPETEEGAAVRLPLPDGPELQSAEHNIQKVVRYSRKKCVLKQLASAKSTGVQSE